MTTWGTEMRILCSEANPPSTTVPMTMRRAWQGCWNWRSVLMSKSSGHSMLFAAFSGEEKGLWGSNQFCETPTINLDSVRYMINFDMVGRLRGDTLAVYGTGTSPGWMELLESCNEDSLILVPSESGVGPSDHTSFYLEDIPVLHFFTGQHPDYTSPVTRLTKSTTKASCALLTLWNG